MTTWIIRAAIAGALALSALGLFVVAASAGERENIETRRGLVSFDDHGETVIAFDKKDDHIGILANITWNHGTLSVHDPSPKGIYPEKNASIPEGRRVWLIMCYTRHGDVFKCSRSQRAVA